MTAPPDETTTDLHAVIAALRAERDAALARETALAEVIAAINRSPGDPGPVFETILQKAHSLCGATIGSLGTYDGMFLRNVAAHGYPPNSPTMVTGAPFRPTAGASQRLINGERLIHYTDVAAMPPETLSNFRDVIERLGVRTVLLIPLRKDGAYVGGISALRTEAKPFTDTEISLLESFADQAVIAIENARLITEQREALEQQTATAEVLQVINANPGDLAPVFDAMLEKAMRLCGAAFGEFHIFDGERFVPVALLGLPANYAEFRLRTQPIYGPGTLVWRVREGADVLHIADLMDEEVYRHGDPQRRAMVDLGGARTGVSVALRKDGLLLGMINIYRQEVRPFSDRQIALLENFAAQAVIAMENARLLGELRQRTGDLQETLEYQTATSDVLKVISRSGYDLKAVLQVLLDTAARLCAADFGALMIRDGDVFRTSAIIPISPEHEAFVRRKVFVPSPHGSVVERTAFARQITHTEDIATLSDYVTSGRGFVVSGTALGVPLFLEGDVVGVFTLHRQRTEPFTDRQIELVSTFADQAVIAIENTRLLTEQREALEQQTATTEVLQVINTSPGDLAPVFDVMLEKAMRVCEAAFGALFSYDGEHLHVTAVHGVPTALERFLRQGPHRPSGFLLRLLHAEPFEQIADLTLTGAYRGGEPLIRNGVDLGGMRTHLAVPLRRDGKALGLIAVYRQEVRLFTSKQIALLQNFASQAVIAMENARLLNEVRQRQEELRITFENMGDGVAMFDKTQHLVAWNRNFQVILDVPDDIIARRQTFSEYVHYLSGRGEYGHEADPEEHVRQLIEQAGQSRTYERTRPDGRVIEIRHNPVVGGGFVLIYADITERKRSEAEIRAARDAAEEASRTIDAAYRELKTAQANLIQAEKMASLGQLTAGIAHEIKNPLNFVNNFSALSTELIDELRDVLAPEPLGATARTEVDGLTALLKGNLEKVVQHGQRADGIVRSMLDHSRGSSGEWRTVDLNVLIDEALSLAYHGARAQDQSFNITLERDFGESIAPIEVNPQDMTRVFLNLFANGFYATTRRAREGRDTAFVPTLKVTTLDAGETVEVRVRDNGTGIPDEIRDKLFQPFFTTKPTGEGTGLGLSITYDIVTQQHGGSIAVDSKVGDYSEFTIRLPRYRP